jgi:hypothetical protein
MRTDYTSRDRYRVRAGFHTAGNMFRVGFTGEDTQLENDLEGGGFDGNARQWTIDAEASPLSALRLRASYAILDSESTAQIRRPETFAVETWRNTEEGDVLEGGIALLVKALSVDLGLSRYENEGTFPFTVDRWRMRSVYDFKTHYGVAAEWSRDRYDEDNDYGQFSADRYGVFFRYRR